MHPKKIVIAAVLLVALAAFTAGCVFFSGQKVRANIRTQSASAQEVTGTYTVIMYGGNYFNDIETIAVLDKEGDPYTIEPYAPAFDYKVRKGVPAKDALEMAQQFISYHPVYYNSVLKRIVDEQGAVIGYELRPLYEPLTYGRTDVLDVNYWTQDSTVYVRIKLKPEIERMLRSSGNGVRDRR